MRDRWDLAAAANLAAAVAFTALLALTLYGAVMSDIEKHKNCLWAAENSVEAYRRFCK